MEFKDDDQAGMIPNGMFPEYKPNMDKPTFAVMIPNGCVTYPDGTLKRSNLKWKLPTPKYKVGQEVWFNAIDAWWPFKNHGICFSEIVKIRFNEDEDMSYELEKFRGAIRHIYLENELYASEEAYLKANK